MESAEKKVYVLFAKQPLKYIYTPIIQTDMPSNTQKKKKQTKSNGKKEKEKKLFRLKCRINSIYDTLVSKREKKERNYAE